MDIADELERSRLLGTTRPTDEEIVEALREGSDDECARCEDTLEAANALANCHADGCVWALQNLLSECGLSTDNARLEARAFIERATKKAT